MADQPEDDGSPLIAVCELLPDVFARLCIAYAEVPPIDPIEALEMLRIEVDA